MEVAMLDLTPRTKNFLDRNNITIEILESYDLLDFQKNYNKPHKHIMGEILEKGFLKPKNGERYIRDLEISNRLRKILEENNIFYLSDLKYCTETEIKRCRNLGDIAFNELMTLCNKHNTNIYSMPKSTPASWKRKRYYSTLEDYCAKKQVDSLEIFKDITALELYNMAEQDYILTAILYTFLSDIQTFKPWKDDAFVFEYFNISSTKKIFQRHKLMYMSDLSNFYNNLEPNLRNYFQPIFIRGLNKWSKEKTINN